MRLTILGTDPHLSYVGHEVLLPELLVDDHGGERDLELRCEVERVPLLATDNHIDFEAPTLYNWSHPVLSEMMPAWYLKGEQGGMKFVGSPVEATDRNRNSVKILPWSGFHKDQQPLGIPEI